MLILYDGYYSTQQPQDLGIIGIIYIFRLGFSQEQTLHRHKITTVAELKEEGWTIDGSISETVPDHKEAKGEILRVRVNEVGVLKRCNSPSRPKSKVLYSAHFPKGQNKMHEMDNFSEVMPEAKSLLIDVVSKLGDLNQAVGDMSWKMGNVSTLLEKILDELKQVNTNLQISSLFK